MGMLQGLGGLYATLLLLVLTPPQSPPRLPPQQQQHLLLPRPRPRSAPLCARALARRGAGPSPTRGRR